MGACDVYATMPSACAIRAQEWDGEQVRADQWRVARSGLAFALHKYTWRVLRLAEARIWTVGAARWSGAQEGGEGGAGRWGGGRGGTDRGGGSFDAHTRVVTVFALRMEAFAISPPAIRAPRRCACSHVSGEAKNEKSCLRITRRCFNPFPAPEICMAAPLAAATARRP